MNRAEGIEIFAKRWEEAKASGCTAVLFEKEKWPLIDMLIDEAQRAQKLRRDLIEEIARRRSLDDEEKASENTDSDGGKVDPESNHRSATRAA